MKFLTILILGSVLHLAPNWGNDLEKAKQEAAKEHKLVLLNFSGSDWCIPCIRMHDEIFQNDAFAGFASNNLILVNADFPRLKKHALSNEQQHRNEALAEKYNSKGIFPLTLLLDSEGKVIRSWEGFPKLTAGQFVDQIKNAPASAH